jgi:hypothetical protein
MTIHAEGGVSLLATLTLWQYRKLTSRNDVLLICVCAKRLIRCSTQYPCVLLIVTREYVSKWSVGLESISFFQLISLAALYLHNAQHGLPCRATMQSYHAVHCGLAYQSKRGDVLTTCTVLPVVARSRDSIPRSKRCARGRHPSL